MYPLTKIKLKTKPLTVAMVSLLILTSCSLNNEPKTQQSTQKTKQEVELKTTMRKLWEDHIYWTRNVIFCIVDELPGKHQAKERLLENQSHLGNVMAIFYGDAAGSKYTALLKEHINLSTDVIYAGKSNNINDFKAANAKWKANAGEISIFLNGINPNWELNHTKLMMQEHLNLTIKEVTHRANKNYANDVLMFDKIHLEILVMADMFTDGIVKHFPEKFEMNSTLNITK